MKNCNVNIGASFGTIAILMFSQAAQAQSRPVLQAPAEDATGQAPSSTTSIPAVQDSNAIPDIVVTALKRSESANRTGLSINAVSGADLTKRGITSTDDLVKIVPGFTYTQSSYGNPVYTLRGIGFYDTSLGAPPAVSLYVDEAPLPYSILSTAATLDLERVEVLKGPQGTLFGQNSTGGAINYIAAKPTDILHAGGSVTYGRFNQADAQGFVSGPLSSTLKIRVAASVKSRGDWQYSTTRSDKFGKGFVGAGRILLDWTPSQTVRFALNLNGFIDRSDNQAQQFIAILRPRPGITPASIFAQPVAPANDRAADWDSNTQFRRRNNYYQASLRSEFNLGSDATLTGITTYQKFTRDSVVDADGTQVHNFTVGTPGYVKSFSQELRVAGGFSKIKYVVGGNFSTDRIGDNIIATFPDASLPYDGGNEKDKHGIKTYAAFGNIDWNVADRLTVTGGLRYTDVISNFSGCFYDNGAGDLAAYTNGVAIRGGNLTSNLKAGDCTTLDKQFRAGVVHERLAEGNVSWRTGINFQATRDMLFYGNVSRAYKSGVFTTTAGPFAAQFVPAKQESVLAYEAGFKLGLAARTVQLNGAIFYYDYSNKQIKGKQVDPTLGPVNALINIPKSDVVGGELQLNWRPLPGLALQGGASYTKSQIRGNFTNYNYLGLLQNFGGNQFPLMPKLQLSGDAEYEYAIGPMLSAFVGSNITYQSQAFAQLGEIPQLRIAPYALVDFRLGVRRSDQRWSVMGFVKNAFNKYYWTYIPSNGFDTVTRLAGQPATYGVTLGLRL